MKAKRLDNYLVENGYYESRARAASAIKAGLVTIDGSIAKKASVKVTKGAVITAKAEHPWVSRGGQKLAHALEVFSVNVSGRICLDVGASTGGFTDVLLNNGASSVYAVDVGRDQLHPKLRNHPDVVTMEATDARTLTLDDFPKMFSLIVCDASFISAAKVLENPLSLAPSQAELVTLFKPQFEVGPDNIGRGGLVKNEDVTLQALGEFIKWIAVQGWAFLAKDVSPIKGGDGNTEYLLHARKK